MKDIIFDIDGTIANCAHRQPFVRIKPKNWNAFNKGMAYDTSHDDIIWMMGVLYHAGNRILIATGRTADYREQTEKWLKEVAQVDGIYEKLYMREVGDYRDDGIVKTEFLDQMRQDGYMPSVVFDDRDRVVKAWRQAGLRCFQVAPGDF